MKTNLLKRLSTTGLCWLGLAAATLPVMAQSCPSCRSCQSGQACQSCRPNKCQCGPTCDPRCPGVCGRQDCALCAGIKWLFHDDYYILPPDYGWNVPGKVPVVRQGVSYYRYWPEQWYGTGGSAAGATRQYAMIANPTDTTQLGYTYQQVPYWRPQPSRIPPSPVPSQWHVRQARHGYHGRWHSYYTPIHDNSSEDFAAMGPVMMLPCDPAGGAMSMPGQPMLTPIPDGMIPPDSARPRDPSPMTPIPMPPEPDMNPPAKEAKTAKKSIVGRSLVSQWSRR